MMPRHLHSLFPVPVWLTLMRLMPVDTAEDPKPVTLARTALALLTPLLQLLPPCLLVLPVAQSLQGGDVLNQNFQTRSTDNCRCCHREPIDCFRGMLLWRRRKPLELERAESLSLTETSLHTCF
mmetsp:Transcript_13008/g.26546  ORF Transcript_13008/g.26546 Transcript_13008/m.26546 type:complete len:124 (-) Transcript_13008:278-649(-)